MHLIINFLVIFMVLALPHAVAAMPMPSPEIKVFYTDDRHLFWEGDRQLERNRDKIPDILRALSAHGIDPEKYGLSDIQHYINLDLNKHDKARLDYALTYALLSASSELAGQALPESEFLELAFSRGLKDKVLSLAPDTRLYNVLKARLRDIDKILQQDQMSVERQELRFGDRLFKVGDAHADVPILRARLVDYGASESFGDDPYNYDPILADAVKQFQTAHGLRADGIIGPATLKYLNHSLEDERRQIVLNMARLREPQWRNRPDLRIDVDVARYHLTAYEGGEVAFDMPVVVGTKSRQTNIFTTVMTGVRLNPGWTVPPTIKEEDYIPKLRTDPQLLVDKGIQIYADWAHDSDPIDPRTVDWSLLEDNDIKAMRMFQSAGAGNPLGRYRFLMNNRYDIYLHDTNQKYLFDRAHRAKSSGCVRVQNPRQIAEFLLKDDPAWTSEKLDEYLARGRTFDLGATRNIPVYFDYKTAWINGEGRLILGVDIYDLDQDAYRDIIKKQSDIFDTISSYFNSMTHSGKIAEDNVENNAQELFPISLF